jgi:hypothetical protein
MNKALKITIASLFAVVLISCGQNQTDVAGKQLSTGISPITKSAEFGKPASSADIAALSKELGSYFNGQHASNPQALMGVQTSVSERVVAAQAVAVSNIPKEVFRFYNTNTGAHFFTMSVAERDYVKNTYPFFSYEGSKFLAYHDADPTLSPVYRFYNNITATHFFTISEVERDKVIATWPTIFTYEGVAWHASTASATDLVPVYRFFNKRTGTHFYTASETEKDHIIATWNWFTFEGTAYFVRPVTDASTCIPPTCYAPADRPLQTSSKNIFWLRTDSSNYEFLTSNQLIYSESISNTPAMSSYDHSMGFNFGANSFFIKPNVSLPTVYQNQYVVENMIDSNAVFKLGLNKYASASTYGISPTLRVGTDGKGCDRSSGAFFIHELETAVNGSVTKFAADFNINCSGSSNGGANGVVRYNSSVASVLPQIFAVAGPDLAVTEGSRLTLLGHLSWSPSSKIKTAKWTQLSGPTLDLSQCAQLTCNTYAPLMPAGGATAVLKLTVETESGLVGSDTVNVAIRTNLDKQTRVDVWGAGFAAKAVDGDLHLNDLSARLQVPALLSLGTIYQDQTSERVHVIARGRSQNGGDLMTGLDMMYMSRAGQALVPGSYLNINIRGGYEAYPEGAAVNVSAEGAGCGNQIASMHVGDIQRDVLDYGKISSLSILTQTNCTDAGFDEATYSRLWINHQPINIPVAKITGAAQSSAVQQVTLNSNTSLVKKGTLVNKVWRIIYSTAEASFSNVGVDTINLNFGANSPSGSKAIVSLEVFDSAGDSATTIHTVTIP